MIITLAGHVDHGKTSLVNALTGVNTDRLQEEQARGLTIDLGFAYIDEGAIGFVDVPGHQKFIHNMVAGVAADQFALLVIAADDGPMPQSKEHLDILKLVGVSRGVIALSKCDRVDGARLDEVEAQIRNLTQDTFLAESQILRTSIEDPESIQQLLNVLRQVQQEQALDTTKPFRLAIDRAFTIKGAGVVVTGTAHSGQLETGQELFHFPSGRAAKVRGLRVQNQERSQATQGDRCAINITGIDLDEVKRGDWLTSAQPEKHIELTIDLDVLNDFPRAVKQWTPVHIYHATQHVTGHIALHAGSRLAAGSRKLVDLICETPLCVKHGDHLVIRDHGLDTTLGGGKVVHAHDTVTVRRRNPQRLDMLNAYAADSPATCLANLLSIGACELASFQTLWQLNDDQLSELLKENDAITLTGHAISRTALGNYAKEIVGLITKQINDNPSSRGLKVDAFKNIPKPVLEQVLQALVQAKRIQVVNGVYGLVGHEAALPSELERVWKRAKTALDNTQPPSSGDLAKAWNEPQQSVQRALRELAKRGFLIQVADHRFYLPTIIEEIANKVAKMASKAPFSVKEFRDATGIGRNVAIDILEYFDAKGFTRREENHRKLLREKL